MKQPDMFTGNTQLHGELKFRTDPMMVWGMRDLLQGVYISVADDNLVILRGSDGNLQIELDRTQKPEVAIWKTRSEAICELHKYDWWHRCRLIRLSEYRMR